jgi:5'-3' exonuclease
VPAELHLIDATYELFRAWFGAPPKTAPDGREVGASRGVLASLLQILRSPGPVFIGCASDHVVRSFRNDLAQFSLLEDLLGQLGLVVWPMVEFEADDAMAAAAHRFAKDFSRINLCTVDKDLAQCVRGRHTVMVDRRRKIELDADAVREKFGVSPEQIPDYLALVGDAADGYPGIRGFGAKSAASVLRTFGALETISREASAWPKDVRGVPRLVESLFSEWENALLFKRLATLRLDVPMKETVADLEWRGARPEFRDTAARLGFPDLCDRVPRWAAD